MARSSAILGRCDAGTMLLPSTSRDDDQISGPVRSLAAPITMKDSPRGHATALLQDGTTAGHAEQNEPAVLADAFDTALLVLVERYRTARQFAPQRLLRSAYLRLLWPEGLGRIDRLRPGRDGGRTGE